MKARSPAFQFYPKDWLADERTRSMSFEEKGIYIDLLAHCWIEGSIPESEVELQSLLGIPGSPYGMAGFPSKSPHDLSYVIKCFEAMPRHPGRLIHLRLESERATQLEFRAKQKQRADKGWKKRKSLGGNDVA